MNLQLYAPPASEPVTLAEAKLWLRLDSDTEDALVASLITAARQIIERETRRCLITQGWRIILDAWPADGIITLPVLPVRQIEALRVHDAEGIATLVPAGSYQSDLAREPARLRLMGALPQPGRPDGIEIDVICGFGAAADVPETLRQAMRQLIARFYENRGDVADIPALPADVAALAGSFRRLRIA